jgi:hypothetical protein
MKVYKIVQTLPEKTFNSEKKTYHVVFNAEEDELVLVRKLNDNKNNGIIADYNMTEVNLRMCCLDQITVGMNLEDFTKLVRYFTYNTIN